MTTTTLKRAASAQATTGLRAAFDALRARVAAWARRRAEVAATIRELDALSDRDLADLGFNRCDLRAIAVRAADAR